MKRLSSQLIFCSPEQVLRNTVVEINNDGVVSRLIDLQHQQTETAHTLFFDGLISAGIVSLKSEISDCEINAIKNDYNYIDLSANTNTSFTSNKPLIIDFGTKDYHLINKILSENYSLFQSINMYKIISGCTYYPLALLNKREQIRILDQPQLILWQNLDFTNKHLLAQTRIKQL